MNEIKKTGPKDVFFQLLNIIALYACVIFFGILIFKYIDIYFPDILKGHYASSLKSALRWPTAALTVIFPLYAWTSFYLQKDLAANPEKRELKTRKWLLYFTLFISIIVIAGDFVTLIYQFLSGGLTTPFLLKILAVFVMAVAVFIYYGWNIRKEIAPSSNPKMKLFVRAMVLLGGVAISFGFYAAGSPRSERLRQFDDRRVNDLMTIQWQVVDYWQSKAKVPANLDELRNDITGFIPPKDPESNYPYEYSATGATSFELCAAFKTVGENNIAVMTKPMPVFEGDFARGAETENNWAHGEGRTCFKRTIDPERFPPRKEKI